MLCNESNIVTPRGVFHVIHFGDPSLASGPLLVYVHGAGMNGWGFQRVAEAVQKLSTGTKATPEALGLTRPLPTGTAAGSTNRSSGYAGLAVDLRCHGGSTDEGGASSLTMDTLVEDCFGVLAACLPLHYPRVQSLYLVGHSLGGAVVVNLAHRKPALASVRLGAVVVLDVVEGTAKQSLAFMKGFLSKRPTTFKAEAGAVNWFLAAGGMKNPEAASSTVPTLLRKQEDGTFTWRTDLAATLSLWEGWFEDLDRKFVSCPVSKMLVLAGTDRLDKDLTIAQMQGKFQFEVIGGGVGHYLMEDAPDALASKLTRLVDRNEVLLLRLPPP